MYLFFNYVRQNRMSYLMYTLFSCNTSVNDKRNFYMTNQIRITKDYFEEIE